MGCAHAVTAVVQQTPESCTAQFGALYMAFLPLELLVTIAMLSGYGGMVPGAGMAQSKSWQVPHKCVITLGCNFHI